MVPRFLALLLFAAASGSGVAAAACPATAEELAARLASAEAAYGHDASAFRAAADEVATSAACLGEIAPPSLVVRLHRVEGLRAYVDRDPVRSVAAFGAARIIEPAWVFPETMVPARNPLRDDYAAADVSAPVREELPAPVAGTLFVDGRPSRLRARDFPALVQVADAEGAIAASAYAWPGEEPPAYAVATPAAVAWAAPAEPPREAPTTARKRSPGPILAVAAGGSALAAGIAYGLAYATATEYRTGDHADATLETMRSEANGQVIASAVLGGVALATGAVAVVTLPW